MPYFDVKSPRRGAKIRLDAAFFVIGRGERIPIFHDDPSISREHAAVVIRESGVRVRDLGSKNGVLLNGTSIGRYAEVPLRPGDTLQVGATTLTLREGEPPARAAAPEPKAPEERPPPSEPVAAAMPASASAASAEFPRIDAPRPSRDGEDATGVRLPPLVTPPSTEGTAEEAPVEDLSQLEKNPAPDLGDSSESEPEGTEPQLE